MSTLFKLFADVLAPAKTWFDDVTRPALKETLSDFLQTHPVITQKEFDVQQKILQEMKSKLRVLQTRVSDLENKLSSN